jgi:hypothetical protein
MTAKQLRSINDCGNMTKRDLLIEAIGEDATGIDYALPQNWLDDTAQRLKDKYSYDTIRVSLVVDYRDYSNMGKFLPITSEGVEILKLLNYY